MLYEITAEKLNVAPIVNGLETEDLAEALYFYIACVDDGYTTITFYVDGEVNTAYPAAMDLVASGYKPWEMADPALALKMDEIRQTLGWF